MAFRLGFNFRPRTAAAALALLALLLVAGPAYTQVYSPYMDPPTLISPPDGAQTTGDPNAPPGYVSFPPVGFPTLIWTTVPGATKYKLEISPSPAFQPVVVLRDNLRYIHYTPTGEDIIPNNPGLTDHTTFYWRVSAWDPQANAWTNPSVPWSFTRNWGIRPTTQNPPNYSTLPFTPRFEWTMVPGTRQYELQISTSPNFQGPITYLTTQPYFTPDRPLANDVDYYWRVRPIDWKLNPGDWSNDGNGWQFRVRWSYWSVDGERRPRPLTPPNLTVIKGVPLFTWTPVAGAKLYDLDISTDPNFQPGTIVKQVSTPNTAWAVQLNGGYTFLQANRTYYWRVRARSYVNVNGTENYGQWNSETPAINYAFITSSSLVASAPSLMYPLYYFDPSINVGAFSDYTVPVGTFMWDHLPGATSYTLEVDDDPVFSPPLWVTTTQNLNVTLDAPFNPATNYYWRVRANPQGTYSDIWMTRVNTSLLGGHTSPPPQLLRPTYKQEADTRTYGFESVEYWPSFEWLPVTGAAQYQLQIARYSDMTGMVLDARTHLTNYTPLTRYGWGTYYWRVRALDGNGNPIGDWSSTYRFIISSQVQSGTIAANASNDFPAGSLLATDPVGDAPAGGFDLRELYTAIGRNTANTDMWYIGIQAGAPITAPVRYGIYLDKNHAECINAPSCDSGATMDPLSMNLTATPPHRPEYAIYLDLNGGSVITATLYSWTGTAWGTGIPLTNLAGGAYYNTTTSFIKIAVPFTAIGNPYSISFMALSANPSTGQAAQDTVPSNAGNSLLVSFITDDLAPTPVQPPNNPVQQGARSILPMAPIFMWHTLDNVAKYRIQVAVDYGFSNIYRNMQGWTPDDSGSGAYSGMNPYFVPEIAFADNNTYYWREAMVQPRPPYQGILGQFGQPSQFTKFAYIPENLSITPLAITTTWRTPSFQWDAAEGAAQYRLKVYLGGGTSPVLTVETAATGHTPVNTLEDGSYTWKLEARDSDGAYSTQLATGLFTKVYSAVVPLSPLTPTLPLDPLEFRWTPVDTATRYQIQTARDANFSTLVDQYITWSATFTPDQTPRALQGSNDWYWRVRIIDGSNRYGPWVQLHIPAGGGNNKLYLPLVVK